MRLARSAVLLVVLLVAAAIPAPRIQRAQATSPIRAAPATTSPTPARYVTTLAGPRHGLDGTGEAASFNEPEGVAISHDGSFALVADTSSHTIRRIDLTTHLVTTLAGLPGTAGNADGRGFAARFDRPLSISLGRSGSFALVADDNGFRRVGVADGEVTTLLAASCYRCSVALSDDESFALLMDAYRYVKKISLANNQITQLVDNVGTWYDLALSRDNTFALATDYFGDVIKKLDLTTQPVTVSTLAGSGTCGHKDDFGTAAEICEVDGIALSHDGRFAVFTDGPYEDYVRRVDIQTGQVSTLAGGGLGSADGVGAAASFFNLGGIALGPDDSYALVADWQNYNIRRVQVIASGSAVAGTVSTLAGELPYGIAEGTGSVARFNDPRSIALSRDGRFALVTDRGDGKVYSGGLIRRVQVADEAIASGTTTTTVSTGLSYPDGLALSSNGSFALVADDTDVKRIDFSVTPPAVVTLTSVPSRTIDIALSHDERFALVIAEDHTVRRVEVPTGTVTLLAGAPNQPGDSDGAGTSARFRFGYFGDAGIALSHDDSFALVADSGNQTIRRIQLIAAGSAAAGTVTTLAGSSGNEGYDDGIGTAARFDLPNGIVLSSDDSYALVTQSSALRQIDIATRQVTTLFGCCDPTQFADGFGFSVFPGRIALSDDGSFALVADGGNYAVRRVGAPPPSAGKVTTLAGKPLETGTRDGQGLGARFKQPSGIAMSDTGIALVADTNNHTIRRVIVPNGDVFTLAGKAGVSGHDDGPGPNARFNSPTGVAINSLATVGLVADTGNNTIRRVDGLSGVVTTLAGSAIDPPGSANGVGGVARFNAPVGVALSADGSFGLVADTGNHTIRRIQVIADGSVVTGTVTTLAGQAGAPGSADGPGPDARFNTPVGVTLSRDGSFALVADQGNNAIRRIDLTSDPVKVTTLARDVLPVSPVGPAGLVVIIMSADLGCNGQSALLTDSKSNTVRSLDVASGTIAPLAGKPGTTGSADGFGASARFNGPSGIASSCYEGGNTGIVADTDNQTIRPISLNYMAYLPLVLR